MTIFDGNLNVLPWLQEKTLRALQVAVSLVDLANEPDTTAWYRRNLLSIAEGQIDRLAPVVALLYQAGSAAADREEWGAMLEGGSFALGAWCKKWQIADPHNVARGSLRHLRAVEEQDEKAQEISAREFDGDEVKAIDLKLQIYSQMSRQLLDETLTREAHRLLLWLMGSLWLSEPPDVVRISRRFLPTDISVSRSQAASAYKELYERGLLERLVDEGTENTDRLSLRLVVRGLNDSRHPPDYEDVDFGYEGARIGGKVTCGQSKFIKLPETFSAMLKQWFDDEQQLASLRDALQEKMGDEKIYIERVEVGGMEEGLLLLVSFRYPMDKELKPLEMELAEYSEEWFRERLVHQ